MVLSVGSTLTIYRRFLGILSRNIFDLPFAAIGFLRYFQTLILVYSIYDLCFRRETDQKILGVFTVELWFFQG